MKRLRLRSCLATAVLVVMAAVAWHYFAPTNIGGSTRYVVTSGISMKPRLRTGDLAIVRPASSYAIGDIVAYRSSVLHVVVLHRIIGRRGDRYVFKGDANGFVDPVYPTRADLLGKLWLHVAHGGFVLKALHGRFVAAVLCAVVAVLLFVGVSDQRRRRKRRRTLPSDPAPKRLGLVSIRDHTAGLPWSASALRVGAGVATAVFAVLCLLAFTRPASKPAPRTIPYTQRVKFGYRAGAPAGLVYPTGVVRTGDPIFAQLVHRITFQAAYQLSTAAEHRVTGTEQIELELTGPSGWTRNVPLGSPMRFRGDQAAGAVTVDLGRVQQVMNQLARLIGAPATGTFSFNLVAHVAIGGRIGGRPFAATFNPGLGLNFTGVQLQIGPTSSSAVAAAASSGSGSPQSALTQTSSSSIALPGSVSNGLHLPGVTLPILALRLIAVIGLLLSAAAAAVAFLVKRGEPFEEAVQIRNRYRHLIVPVVLEQNDLGWPAVEVADIKALVRLAESGQRLILHRPDPGGDTFLVNEEGTVYRYQVKPSNVVWGEWKPAVPRPLATAEPEAEADSTTA